MILRNPLKKHKQLKFTSQDFSDRLQNKYYKNNAGSDYINIILQKLPWVVCKLNLEHLITNEINSQTPQ